MKKRLNCLLLLCLLLAGCARLEAPAATSATGAAQTTAAVPTLPPETTAPAETEAPVTEPPIDLRGVEMELSRGLRVSPDAPKAELLIRFPAADLPEQAERGASLTLAVDGQIVKTWPELWLEPGLELRCELEFPFERYQPDRRALVTATLCRGQDRLIRQTSVGVDNYDEAVYQLLAEDSLPYRIDVIRSQNVVVVYGRDEQGEYTVPVKSWLCSTGYGTPRGSYRLGRKKEWGALFGGVYGQYVCGISGDILFHSVPYARKDKGHLKTAEYNRLGTAASMGCVRLPICGAKWIYDYCPTGTPIRIFDAEELPVPRPTARLLDPEDPRSGWDPTDPDPANPWRSPKPEAMREMEAAEA